MSKGRRRKSPALYFYAMALITCEKNKNLSTFPVKKIRRNVRCLGLLFPNLHSRRAIECENINSNHYFRFDLSPREASYFSRGIQLSRILLCVGRCANPCGYGFLSLAGLIERHMTGGRKLPDRSLFATAISEDLGTSKMNTWRMPATDRTDNPSARSLFTFWAGVVSIKNGE